MSETTINAGHKTPFDQEQSLNKPEERHAKHQRAQAAAEVGEKAGEGGVVDSEPVKR